MFDRMFRAFKNDVTLYPEIKGNSEVQTESIGVILIIAVFSAIVTALGGLLSGTNQVSMLGDLIIGFLTLVIGYCIIIILAWLFGSVIGSGNGSITDLRIALAYGYTPLILSGIPYIGIIFSLWTLVTMSSAIRETLNIGKALTFFIVIVAAVVQLFVVVAFVTSLFVGIFALQ